MSMLTPEEIQAEQGKRAAAIAANVSPERMGNEQPVKKEGE